MGIKVRVVSDAKERRPLAVCLIRLHFTATLKEKTKCKSLIFVGISLMQSFMAAAAVQGQLQKCMPDTIVIAFSSPLTVRRRGRQMKKQGIDLAHELYPM
jgi:hypothetical protein